MANVNIDKEQFEVIQDEKKGKIYDIKLSETIVYNIKFSKLRRKRCDDADLCSMMPVTFGKGEDSKGVVAFVSDNESTGNKNTSNVIKSRWEEIPGSSSVILCCKRSCCDTIPAFKVEELISSNIFESLTKNSSLLVVKETTPIASNLNKAVSLDREMETRNRAWTYAAFDAILLSEGYEILYPPANYNEIWKAYGLPIASPTTEGVSGVMPFIKPEDMQ